MHRRRNPTNTDILTYAAAGAAGVTLLGKVLGPGVSGALLAAVGTPIVVALARGESKDVGSAALAGLGGALAVGAVLAGMKGCEPCGQVDKADEHRALLMNGSTDTRPDRGTSAIQGPYAPDGSVPQVTKL